jgi:hypothetical protein
MCVSKPTNFKQLQFSRKTLELLPSLSIPRLLAGVLFSKAKSDEYPNASTASAAQVSKEWLIYDRSTYPRRHDYEAMSGRSDCILQDCGMFVDGQCTSWHMSKV